MSRCAALVAVLVVGGVPISAQAQTSPAGGQPAAERRLILDAGLFAAGEEGDLDEIETSPGVRVSIGYGFVRGLSGHFVYRHIFMRPSGVVSDQYSYSYSDLGIGARYQLAITDAADFLVEGEVANSSLTVSYSSSDMPTISMSESDIGLLGRAGALFHISSRASFLASASYSHATITFADSSQSIDVDVDWFSLEGSAEVRF